MPLDTIPSRLFDRARERPTATAYRHKVGDHWVAVDWRTYAEQVRTVATSFLSLGLQPGQRVCALGFNRPEWVLFDIGAMMVGGTPAGIYTTCSPEEVGYILRHGNARVVLVEDPGQLAKVLEVWDTLPELEHAVLMGDHTHNDPRVLSWQAFLALEGSADDAEARMHALQDTDLATLIYTSGTTGPPKAVMLTHGNLRFTSDTAVELVQAGPGDRLISYLPLSHIAEQVFSIHGALTAGYEIWFARSMEQLLEDLGDARPTVFFGVPRVWEKMHARLSSRLDAAEGLKGLIARWALGVGRSASEVRNRGAEPAGLLALQYRLADRLLFSKVKGLLGLDALRYGVSGAAPISADILRFFSGLDISILEVYGQSEDTGPTTFNRPGRVRYGTVGEPIPGTEVRIAEDGEVCVRGPHVFAGYLHDEAATAATLIEGWLHSGDLGSIDADGFLTITGRKKDILITAGGKNIAPANIEAALKDLPLVSQAVVIGDRRKFLSALVTLDPEAAEAFASEHGLSTDGLHAHDAVRTALQKGIDEAVNPRFARVEHVRKFTVLSRDLSIEDGELTPTMKVKRRVVDAHFADQIEAMYQ
jgi:long-chain acyl-CoA synthetase